MANEYRLQYTIRSMRGPVGVMEFSSCGRLLVVADGHPARLRVLDRTAKFGPTIEVTSPSRPTSLAFGSSTTLLVGLEDGRFVKYTINFETGSLVKGWSNSSLRGPSSAITAISLNKASQVLALVAGPTVFVFTHVPETGEFQYAANITKYFNFESSAIGTPLPVSLCFSLNDQLHVTFRGQHVASINLTLEKRFGLQTAFPASKIDYSGLPILRTVLSMEEELISSTRQFWICNDGEVSEVGGNAHTDLFLFINGGAGTLSTSSPGSTSIKNAVTQRLTQLLEHDDRAARPLTIAYHSGRKGHTIATATGSSIKIWMSDRTAGSRGMQSPPHRSRSWGSTILLTVVVVVVALLVEGFFLDFFDSRPLCKQISNTLVCWIRWCFSVVAYFETVVKGVVGEWYRSIGTVFMRLAEEGLAGE